VSYRRVLLILKGYLGDAVMVTPLLEGLVAQPNLEVHALTTPSVISLLEDTFPTVRFQVQKNLRKPMELLAEARELRAQDFDATIVVNRSFRSALLASMARIPVRVGHGTDRRGWLLTRSTPHDLHKNETESYLELAQLAGLELPEIHPRLTPPCELLGPTSMKLQGATIGIQPGARHPWKKIPASVLAQVVGNLQEHAMVVLMGGPEEKTFGEELERELAHKPLNLIGAFSLKESLAAASQLKVMVGGDTGLMHMAAATGCPTVTMFGPTFASKWGHYYEPHQVLVAPGREMSEFTAEEILAAVRRAICC
jgi:heptosyltransferase-2